MYFLNKINLLHRSIFLFCMMLGFGFSLEQEQVILDSNNSKSIYTVGLKFQKVYNLYYENGCELGYTHEKLWDKRIQFKLSYVTSRLGSAMGSNAIKQDNYVLGTGLHFRPGKLVDPYIKLNLGYFYFDTEIKAFDFLPNSSMLAALGSGVNFNVYPKIGSFYFDMNFNLITGNGEKGPGTLYPLYFNLGFAFNLSSLFSK